MCYALASKDTFSPIWESPAQFEKGIKPRVYEGVFCVVLCTKSSILLAGKGVRKISFLACEFSSIKIHLSDYPKTLISRINEVDVFSIKYSYK